MDSRVGLMMGEVLRGRACWYLVALSVLIALFGIGDVIGGIRVIALASRLASPA